ncbi:UTP--glucose-1-phosphate uridylyltransferase, partial [Priestia megaterium]
RYDVGEKLGFIQTTIEFALQQKELRTELIPIIENLLKKSKISL